MTMRARLLPLVILASAAGISHAAQPAESARDLVREVVFNEMRDHQLHGFWQYQVEKNNAQQNVVEQEIETSFGRIDRVIAANGVVLSRQQQQQEEQRLAQLERDRSQQAKLKQEYDEEERRIGSMMKMMPDAFFYEYDSAEGDLAKLRFTPNPSFDAPTYQTRVFHAMAGTVWINLRAKRLARIEGRLTDDVQFGFGLLGRVNKGGTFIMERGEISPGDWKTRLLDVHISGHVVLLKCIGKDEHQVRSGFRPVPANLNIAQATALLNSTVAHNQAGPLQMQPVSLHNGSR